MASVSHSRFRRHIEAHFQRFDLDVVVRKRGQGYSIHFADDGEPLARLRPTGQDDWVEIRSWQDDHWEPLGEFGLVLPLRRALRHITTDPEDLFLGGRGDDQRHDVEEDDELEGDGLGPVARLVRSELLPAIERQTQRIRTWAVGSATVGAAAGGLCISPLWAAAVAAASCAAFGLLSRGPRWPGGPAKVFAPLLILLGIPVSAAGIMGSVVGSSLASGTWAMLCGASVAALCSWAMFQQPLIAWIMGFLGALNLGLYLTELWHIDSRFAASLLTALLAYVIARCCSGIQRELASPAS